MSRRSELLRAAAGAMDDGADPFSTWFLTAHEVTLDEVTELADDLSIAAQAAAWAIDNPQKAMKIIQAGLLGARADVITGTLAKLLEKT